MKTLDMMGQACPKPVIEAKKALGETNELEVLVDNEVATKNLSKLASSLGYEAKVENLAKDQYRVFISGSGELPETSSAQGCELIRDDAYSVVIDNWVMGGGSDELGSALMKSFTYALSEQDLAPERMIFFNGGVKVACEGSDSLEDLKKIEAAGTQIVVCGACLDFYGMKEKLAVGEISNMYSIVELMRTSNRIVKP